MLKNYFITAIRAIRRSPWEAMLKIFAIAAGVCTSVLHFAFWYSGDFSNSPELFTGLIILAMTSGLLIQFYGQPQDNREYKLRIILGDEDLLMRGRKIAEAGLIILGGVTLGLVCSDSYFTYVQNPIADLSNMAYLAGVLISGFIHYTIFLFTVWFGSAIVIKNNSESFSRFSKTLAGIYTIVISLAAVLWSIGPNNSFALPKIYLEDILCLSFFAFSSWNRLAQYILESKSRMLSIMKMQGASGLQLIIYWIQQLGPAAFISVGLSVLAGNIYLFFEMPYRDEPLAALIIACWAVFVFVIIILGLSHPVSRGFKQDLPRSIP